MPIHHGYVLQFLLASTQGIPLCLEAFEPWRKLVLHAVDPARSGEGLPLPCDVLVQFAE